MLPKPDLVVSLKRADCDPESLAGSKAVKAVSRAIGKELDEEEAERLIRFSLMLSPESSACIRYEAEDGLVIGFDVED